ncbi:MAG TPA: ankyrin repeat domain-containing protein, partial [Vicinamibacterales bacterium]|nr:ankyrin repeat domain-containing protein [Vicinamibacterales bacterium]
DHGADVNAARKDGTTPLFAAAGGGDLAKVALLIDRGAKLDAAITPAGFTPLHYATLLGDAAMAQLLLRRGANPNATIAVRQHDRAD